MPIITLLTDFGYRDHYVAALKARLLRDAPAAALVDISHAVELGHIASAAFLLGAVYADFPKGTVHLAAVGAAGTPQQRLIAASFDGHYFVGPDNGLLALVCPDASDVHALQGLDEHTSTFPSKYVLAPIAAALASGTPLSAVGEPCPDWVQKRFSAPRVSPSHIQGEVVHIDHYGNLVTNIAWKDFQEAGGGRAYTIRCGYERFQSVGGYYGGKDFGDCVIVFNSQGLLEIAINHGNAAELLGMKAKSPVMVQFE
jgi:hypothetical protein